MLTRRRAADRPDAPPLPTPKTRPQLFRQALSVRFRSMISHSAVTFLFYVPALVWTEMSLRAMGGADEASLLPERLAGAYLFGLFVCLVLTGPAQAGLALLLRNWARGENCYPWDTYFGGMKRNWKQALLAAAFSGAAPLFAYSTLLYYGRMSESASPLYLIPFALCGVAALFLLLMQQTVWTMLVTYSLPFSRILKNALLLGFLELPRGLLALISRFLPLGLLLGLALLFPAKTALFTVLGLAYEALLGLALSRFIAASFANYACEKHINAKLPGARVDIGLTTERDSAPAPQA